MKVSIAGISLKESEKKVYESLCKEKNSQEAEESKEESYDDSSSRPNEIMKAPTLRKSKYFINTGSFRHHDNCGSTHPSMAASEENKLPPSFSGFKSQKFLHESSYDGVSEADMQ